MCVRVRVHDEHVCDFARSCMCVSGLSSMFIRLFPQCFFFKSSPTKCPVLVVLSAERSAAGCSIKLNKDSIAEYLRIVLLKFMISEGRVQ